MAGTCVVLNGPSSAGKSSIAEALRARWGGPLQVSGIDTFLACQSEAFFGEGGEWAPGLTWVPAVVDGSPAFAIERGPLGAGLLAAARCFWRACADAGIDQVVDDVWLFEDHALALKALLAPVEPLWVGVRCPLEEIERRERDRGDRTVGQARGQAHVVHSWTGYDLEVDTSVRTPEACAEVILGALARRRG